LTTWNVVTLVVLTALVAGVLILLRRARQLERVLAASNQKLEQLQRQFESFVPGDVVERLTDERGTYMAHRRQATMLFADLRGFTELCDRLDPTVTITILNGYFQRMSKAIVAHNGHLTELVGDGLLALFGAHEPNPWQGRDSVIAALAMRAALESYNTQLRSQNLPELKFGIGIHSGEVVCGVMGAGELSKFSVTGDAINVASRVEGLTRKHGVDVLITEEIRGALDSRFRLRPMPLAYVKGKVDAIQTYYVEGGG